LVSEVRDYLHEQADAGAYRTDALVRHLQRALDEVWDELTASTEGPGRLTLAKTIAVGDPDGYVPGAELPMPARWRRVVVVRRNGARLVPGDPEQEDIEAGRPGYYWIEGPDQEVSGGLLAPASSVLVTSDAWEAGDVLKIRYVAQAPQLVDPADATIDVQVDLGGAEIASAVAHLAGAAAVARGDERALGRARASVVEALARFRTRSRDAHQRPRRLADYQRGARRR
jgi:hypothetical protein